MIPTAVACVLSVLVVWMAAEVRFGSLEYARLALLFLLYVLYLTVMLLMGLVVSAFVHRSFVALVFCTFAWFLFVTIVPNLTSMIPQFTGQRGQVYDAVQERTEQVGKEEEASVRRLRDPRNPDSVQPRDPCCSITTPSTTIGEGSRRSSATSAMPRSTT
jgi:hypothetical protein